MICVAYWACYYTETCSTLQFGEFVCRWLWQDLAHWQSQHGVLWPWHTGVDIHSRNGKSSVRFSTSCSGPFYLCFRRPLPPYRPIFWFSGKVGLFLNKEFYLILFNLIMALCFFISLLGGNKEVNSLMKFFNICLLNFGTKRLYYFNFIILEDGIILIFESRGGRFFLIVYFSIVLDSTLVSC